MSTDFTSHTLTLHPLRNDSGSGKPSTVSHLIELAGKEVSNISGADLTRPLRYSLLLCH